MTTVRGLSLVGVLTLSGAIKVTMDTQLTLKELSNH